jgi:hypothetical protein
MFGMINLFSRFFLFFSRQHKNSASHVKSAALLTYLMQFCIFIRWNRPLSPGAGPNLVSFG